MVGVFGETYSTELAVFTVEGLIAHIAAYGLDRVPKGYNAGKPKVYKTYKAFRLDSAIEVAKSHCAEETFIGLVAKYGTGDWEDEARADWKQYRADSEEARA